MFERLPDDFSLPDLEAMLPHELSALESLFGSDQKRFTFEEVLSRLTLDYASPEDLEDAMLDHLRTNAGYIGASELAQVAAVVRYQVSLQPWPRMLVDGKTYGARRYLRSFVLRWLQPLASTEGLNVLTLYDLLKSGKRRLWSRRGVAEQHNIDRKVIGRQLERGTFNAVKLPCLSGMSKHRILLPGK